MFGRNKSCVRRCAPPMGENAYPSPFYHFQEKFFTKPSRDAVERLIVIDGCNIARGMSGDQQKTVESAGLMAVIRFFIIRNFDVAVFMPSFYVDQYKGTRNAEALVKLIELQIVSVTPSQTDRNNHLLYYDDLYILDFAKRHGGTVISDDRFKDISSNPNFESYIEVIQRRIGVRFYDLKRDVVNYGRDRFFKYSVEFIDHKGGISIDKMNKNLFCLPADPEYAQVSRKRAMWTEEWKTKALIAMDAIFDQIVSKKTLTVGGESIQTNAEHIGNEVLVDVCSSLKESATESNWLSLTKSKASSISFRDSCTEEVSSSSKSIKKINATKFAGSFTNSLYAATKIQSENKGDPKSNYQKFNHIPMRSDGPMKHNGYQRSADVFGGFNRNPNEPKAAAPIKSYSNKEQLIENSSFNGSTCGPFHQATTPNIHNDIPKLSSWLNGRGGRYAHRPYLYDRMSNGYRSYPSVPDYPSPIPLNHCTPFRPMNRNYYHNRNPPNFFTPHPHRLPYRSMDRYRRFPPDHNWGRRGWRYPPWNYRNIPTQGPMKRGYHDRYFDAGHNFPNRQFENRYWRPPNDHHPNNPYAPKDHYAYNGEGARTIPRIATNEFSGIQPCGKVSPDKKTEEKSEDNLLDLCSIFDQSLTVEAAKKVPDINEVANVCVEQSPTEVDLLIFD